MAPAARTRSAVPRTALAVALALCLPACGKPVGSGGGERKNLVVVVLDTLRPDRLGAYGYDRGTSPHLDAWAEHAVVFERAHSTSPWTTPSLISLLTSLEPSVHGILMYPEPGRLDERITTLAEVLRERGWTTAAFTEGGYAKPQFGLDQGFEVFPTNEGDELGHKSPMDHPSRIASNMDRTLAWLEQHRDQPFFLLFHTYEVHEPYRPPLEVLRRFRPDYDQQAEHARLDAIVARWNTERVVDEEDALLFIRHVKHCVLAGRPDLQAPGEFLMALNAYCPGNDFNQVLAQGEALAFIDDLYDAGVAYADEQLARLWAALERDGLADDTVVVVVSDHGEALGEHGYVGHGLTLFGVMTRIALLLRAPGIEPGRNGELVRMIDVMPTLLDLLDVDGARLPLQGKSLVPWLEGGRPEPLAYGFGVNQQGEELFWHSIRSARWLYVEDHKRGRHWLYDTVADPGETTDVATEHPEVVAGLARELRQRIEADAALRARLGVQVESSDLSAEDLEELRRLGYAGDR